MDSEAYVDGDRNGTENSDVGDVCSRGIERTGCVDICVSDAENSEEGEVDMGERSSRSCSKISSESLMILYHERTQVSQEKRVWKNNDEMMKNKHDKSMIGIIHDV